MKEIEESASAGGLSPGNQVYDVKLFINDFEVPVEDVINYWMDRCEDGVNLAAAELIKEKMDSIGSKLMDAQLEVEETLDKAKEDVIKEFGLSYDRYEDSIN